MFGLNVEYKDRHIIISGFNVKLFFNDIQREFKTSKISKLYEVAFGFFGKKTILHEFFIPELLFILTRLPNRLQYIKLRNELYEKTWAGDTFKQFNMNVSFSKINNDMVFNLKDYQKNFIQQYDLKKQQFNLKGYILAFEQGLGKTFTSLALMHGLNKDCIIIIAPKSTLRTVWQNEIETIFKNKQDIYVIGDNLKNNVKPKFFICNYESISKLHDLIPLFNSYNNIGIIVDECHNFKNRKSKRVYDLKILEKNIKCNDNLLMSGTPIKALGGEMIPALIFIDPMFDSEAQKTFQLGLGLSTDVALSLLKNRLGMIMHRKLKSEVLTLPNKHDKKVEIIIPNGNEYTLETVKDKILKYAEERNDYYKNNYMKYERDFYECINFLRSKVGNTDSFTNYIYCIDYLKKYGYTRFDKDIVDMVKRNNDYEKNVLRPLLPNDMKKKFDASKSVVKYLKLKIMGEVIGGLLNKLRADMFSQMIINSPICEIINNGLKKTICFTTYVDVANNAYKYTKDKCGLDPMLVTGATSGNIKNILKEFKNNVNKNPLIATIQTMSTGVTLTNANNVIFLNQPWRHTDVAQATDRCHRIGQDVDVYIYTLLLKTGNKPNLSTRMTDIVEWSKSMFEGIVGSEQDVNKYFIKHLSMYRN